MSEPDTNFPEENPETIVWDLLQHMDIDPLTGLGNRRKGEDLLNKVIQREGHNGKKVGVVFIDVDNFKPINEAYDHEFGDSVLLEVARGIRNTFRPGDTPIRQGGDEFYVILPDMKEARRIDLEKTLIGKIQDALSSRNDFKSHPEMINIGATLALVFWDGTEDAKHLVNRADKAMNEIKRKKHALGYGYQEEND